MKTKLTISAITLCLTLSSCSSFIDETGSDGTKVMNESLSKKNSTYINYLTEDDIEYGEDYISLFGLLHNEGVEYVLQSLQDSNYYYFSDVEDNYLSIVKNQSLHYIEEAFSMMYNTYDFRVEDLELFDDSTPQLSNDVTYILTTIRGILGSEQSVNEMYYDIEHLQNAITSYTDIDSLIAAASINVALSSLTYWSSTNYTPDVFINPDAASIMAETLSAHEIEAVVMEDIEAVAQALDITIHIYLNFDALINLIGFKYYLITTLGLTVAYTVYKSVCAAIRESEKQALYQIDENALNPSNSCYEFLNYKFHTEPTLFSVQPYQKFLYLFY